VQAGQDRDALLLEGGALLRGGVEQPAAEHVRRVVHRDAAVDLVHDEERGAERAAVRLVPAEPGDRDRAALCDLADDLELGGQVVAGEHRERAVLGC
jgi:hypothetical protein